MHGSYSAVLELIPPIDSYGNYSISSDGPFGPDTLHWDFSCNIVVPMQGGAFRLPNGNTLITLTHIGKIIEVNGNGDNLWEYTHVIDEINNAWIARADKYSPDYFQDTLLLGDLNLDGILNILDIVMMINMILDNEYTVIADINQDESVDILDVVVMVNILMGGLP